MHHRYVSLIEVLPQLSAEADRKILRSSSEEPALTGCCSSSPPSSHQFHVKELWPCLQSYGSEFIHSIDAIWSTWSACRILLQGEGLSFSAKWTRLRPSPPSEPSIYTVSLLALPASILLEQSTLRFLELHHPNLLSCAVFFGVHSHSVLSQNDRHLDGRTMHRSQT